MISKLLKRAIRVNGKNSNNSDLICYRLLIQIFRFFSFKHHVTVTRLLSKNFRVFLEAKIHKINAERHLYYKFEPGYVYPLRNNKIVQLPNVIHISVSQYFTDYNQWLFNYVLKKEIHLTMGSLNFRRTTLWNKIF